MPIGVDLSSGNVAAGTEYAVSLAAGFNETARGIVALMGETTAGDAARTGVFDARRTSVDRGDNSPHVWQTSLPVFQSGWAARLVARLPVVRTLPPDSLAFRILMTGTTVSMFGSRISTVAFPMLVLHLYNSPFITGLVVFAAIVPSMLVYMPAGVLVDRWSPRYVMLVSEICRGLVIFSVVMSLTVFRKHTILGFLISAMVVEEILEIFSTLADRRYLSRLMERENRASRQAYIEVRSHAVVLAGRPVGPFLFWINPYYPFLADALSFLFSIGSLLLVWKGDEPSREPRRIQSRKLSGDIGQGFSWLRQDRRSFVIVIIMAITSLVAQALILMLLAEAHAKELSTLEIGFVLAASGAGGAAGSIFSKFLPDRIKEAWLPIQMTAWSVALAFLAIVGGLSAVCSAAAMFILGFTGAIGNIEFAIYLVATVSDDMIAKVTGFGQMVAIGACAVGSVLGGVAIDDFGIRGTVEILFLIMVLLAVSSRFVPDFTKRKMAICLSDLGPFPHSQSLLVFPRQAVIGPRPAVDDDLEDLAGDSSGAAIGAGSRIEAADVITFLGELGGFP